MRVPKYKELSTQAIWNFVKEVPDLVLYFPDYTLKQYPDKGYLFSILGAIHGDELNGLIQEARKKRSIYEEPDLNEFVEVTEEIKKEIEDVFTQKSKVRVITKCFKLQGEKHVLC